MTAQEDAVLAGRVESALRSTSGVRGVYRSGSLVSNLIGRGAAALGLSDGDEALVAVTWDGDRAAIDASIAVDGATAAVDSVRAAQQAIEALLAEGGVEAAQIRLTVVHVQEV